MVPWAKTAIFSLVQMDLEIKVKLMNSRKSFMAYDVPLQRFKTISNALVGDLSHPLLLHYLTTRTTEDHFLSFKLLLTRQVNEAFPSITSDGKYKDVVGIILIRKKPF